MLEVGERAPTFRLPDDTGTLRSLEEFISAGPVILYFYPADFTPVCTREACAFRDAYRAVGTEGLNVVGISRQSVESHARFKAAYGIPFPLLADESRSTIRAYGCQGLLGIGTRRASFIVDTAGIIRERSVAALRIGPHIALGHKLSSTN